MPKGKKKKIRAVKVNPVSNAYSKIYVKHSVEEGMVLYRSLQPGSIADDLFVLFERLIQDKTYDSLKHVWVLDDLKSELDAYFPKYRENNRVQFVKYGSGKYLDMLASAKYIVYEKYLPRFFVKKPEQVCVNIWTDTPLLKMGMDEKVKQLSQTWNVQKSFYSCDYLITPNRCTTERLFQAYNLEGTYDGKIIEAGYLSHNLLKQGRGTEKTVLYAPSVRRENGRVIDSSKIIRSHVAKLKKEFPKGYSIITRLESADYDSITKKGGDLKGQDIGLVPRDVLDTKLVNKADILITDYSQLMFPFLAAGKPIFFYDFDKIWKTAEEHFYIMPKELPGRIFETTAKVGEAIRQMEEDNYEESPGRKEFIETYLLERGLDPAEIVMNAIFGKQAGTLVYRKVTDKKKLLLHIGLLSRIAERELCMYILRKIDYDKYTVIVDGNDIYPYQREFKKIHEGIQIVNSKFENNKSFLDKRRLKQLNNIDSCRELFHWELNSMYGGLSFDAIIDTVGKQTLWMNVFAAAACEHKALVLNRNNNTLPVVKEYGKYLDRILVVEGEESIKEADNKVTCISKADFIARCGINPLNVLFISAFDSTNYVFVNLIKDLKKRGHSCTVVVKDKDDAINNKMYMQENIEFIEIDEFDLKLSDVVDFVFSAPLKYDCYNNLYKRLQTNNKFIITFASLFSSIVMSVNPDLSLSLGESKFEEFKNNGLKYNLVAIGNPQYDRLIRLRKEMPQKELSKIKNVLMMEQGAYPFGKKGKQELADVLCYVARKNPAVTFTVKPRYLPTEKGKQLHVLSEHLYDFIEDKPDNLILLDKAVVLEDIMHEFDAAMTTWSTAYLDAAVLGLPLILIEGLDSIDVFNVRNQRVNAAYDRLKHSGCVVNYKTLYEEGPLPFCFVEESYLSEELYSPHEPCVPRIMELLEYLYQKLIIPEKRWKGLHQLSYDKLYDTFDEIPLIDTKSNEFRQRRRLMGETNKILQKFIFENRCMAEVMDIAPVYGAWDYEVRDDTPGEEITAAIKALRESTNEIRNRFFTEHFDLVCKDRILQDYYFQWLFTEKKYHELLNYDRELICPESLSFYRAVILYKRHHYKAGTKDMARFLEISAAKECKDLRKDMSLSGYLWKGRLGKYLILYYLDRYGAYEVVESVDSQGVIYQRDIMQYYKVKSYIGRGLYKEAVELNKEYSKSLFKKTKSKSIKTRVKYYVGRFFYKKTERLAQYAKKQMEKDA